MVVNLSFSSRAPAILAGSGVVQQGVFFHHFADVGKPRITRLLDVPNCRDFLGSWTFRKFRKVSVTKCNHLVDFNKVAISREKLFLIRPISADLDYTFCQVIATNILIAYARVGTVCPHPYGWA